METVMKAIEVTGTIDEHRRIELDEELPISGPMHVRVIVLYPETEDLNEADWLKSGANNPAFDYLREPQEDIYSLADGEPFRDEA